MSTPAIQDRIDHLRAAKAARVIAALRRGLYLGEVDPATFTAKEWEIVRVKLGERTLSPATQAIVVAEWHRKAEG